MKLDAARAIAALEERIAKPLGLPLAEAAYGIYTIAAATMTRAVKAVTTYRGRDPRDFVLIGFGGNGPMVAAAVARALSIRKVLIPPAPGVFSALGLLMSEIEHEFSSSLFRSTQELTDAEFAGLFARLETLGRAAMESEKRTSESLALRRFAELRYAGQAYELTIPVDEGDRLADVVANFHDEHRKTYGHGSNADPADVVSIRVYARVVSDGAAFDYERISTRPQTSKLRAGYDAPGLFRPRRGLHRHAGDRARQAERDLACRPPHRRGIRCDLCRPARCTRAARCARQYRDRASRGGPMSAPRLDPITFEVIKNALSSVADEMALIVMRSAYSPVVRDTMDYSTALCDRRGQLIAQGLTLAVQLGSFPDGMRILMADHAPTAQPGDVFLYNDPYGSGGQHLPDFYIVKPIFHDGVIEGWACTMAHHCDVGGIAPGSTAIHATEIFQEGICLPVVKLHEAGVPNAMLLRILEKNTRMPVQLIGDIRAQLAACAVGERGYRALLAKYGASDLRRYLDAMQDQAERMMRSVISEIPDGRYSFEDWIDGVGDVPEPLRIAAEVIVEGDGITIDFTGTSAQVQAAVNCPIAMVNSSTYCAIRCLTDREIPNCEGYMRPVKLIVPRGTILNPEHPAACAARGVMGYRVFDAIMGALAQVVPERVIAGCEGGPTLFSIGGRQNGKPFVLTEVMVGTWGARADARWHRGHLKSCRQLVEQSGRTDRSRVAAAGHRIQLCHGLRRARPPPRRACVQPHLSGARR